MEIRNLNTFLQVVSIKNFTQAAKILGYSQSNVSAQIQQLEREVGAPLFNRIGRQVTLTQHGEELIPYAQKIVATALLMENFLKSKESLGGTLRIGMVESLYEILFESSLLRYHQHFPNVKVELVVDDTATLKNRMQTGVLDFACLIAEPLPKGRHRRHRQSRQSPVPAELSDPERFKRRGVHLDGIDSSLHRHLSERHVRPEYSPSPILDAAKRQHGNAPRQQGQFFIGPAPVHRRAGSQARRRRHPADHRLLRQLVRPDGTPRQQGHDASDRRLPAGNTGGYRDENVPALGIPPFYYYIHAD